METACGPFIPRGRRPPYETQAVLDSRALFDGALVVSPAIAGVKTQVKVGHVNPPGDPSYDAWEFFKKTLEAKSNGRFAVSLYPAGQLGDERELIE